MVDKQTLASLRRTRDESAYHASLAQQYRSELDASLARLFIDAGIPLDKGRLCWSCGEPRDGGEVCPGCQK